MKGKFLLECFVYLNLCTSCNNIEQNEKITDTNPTISQPTTTPTTIMITPEVEQTEIVEKENFHRENEEISARYRALLDKKVYENRDSYFDDIEVDIVPSSVTSKGLELRVSFQKPRAFSYSDDYFIQKKEDGKWIDIERNIFTMSLLQNTLEAKKNEKEININVDWSYYPDLTPGKYRLLYSFFIEDSGQEEMEEGKFYEYYFLGEFTVK